MDQQDVGWTTKVILAPTVAALVGALIGSLIGPYFMHRVELRSAAIQRMNEAIARYETISAELRGCRGWEGGKDYEPETGYGRSTGQLQQDAIGYEAIVDREQKALEECKNEQGQDK